jgi:hypothetical protein
LSADPRRAFDFFTGTPLPAVDSVGSKLVIHFLDSFAL